MRLSRGTAVPWDRELVTSAGILSCAACTLTRSLDTGWWDAHETMTEAALEKPLREDPKAKANRQSALTEHLPRHPGTGAEYSYSKVSFLKSLEGKAVTTQTHPSAGVQDKAGTPGTNPR